MRPNEPDLPGTADHQRLMELEAKLAAISRSQAVVEFDLDGTVLSANPNFLNTFGYAADEVIGHHHSMFVDPDTRNSAEYAAFWETLRRGEFFAAEFKRLGKAGREVWIQATYNPIFDLAGRPFKVVKYASDTTEAVMREQAEAELRAARAAAETTAAAKSDFLANMSHELRTPLTSILGFSRLLAERGKLTKTDRGYLDLIRSAGETLLAVVNDILDFSKLEAGATVLSPAAFSMRDLATGTAALLQEQARAKGLMLDCDIEGEAVLWADAPRLRQILLNLVGNAVKFTEAGHVRLHARAEGLPDGRALLEMAVEDTGPGIDPELIDTLFDRFTQADGSVSRRFGGTGLGLAICRQLVELMGGEIGVESDGKTGSTFRLRVILPFADKVEQIETESRAVDLDGQLRILLAEDHPANRALVAALLSPFEVEIDFAEDGEVAVAAVARQAYDLILMDMQMPVMDGLSAARAIRASSGPGRDTPIVALTANILPEQVQRCLEAGMQGHLAKPIDLCALLEVLNRYGRPDAEAEIAA